MTEYGHHWHPLEAKDVFDRLDHLHKHLKQIEQKVEALMANQEEVLASVEQLKSDLEAKAAEARVEFEKLEAEVAEGNKEPDLSGLKSAIDAIDGQVKEAVIPTT